VRIESCLRQCNLREDLQRGKAVSDKATDDSALLVFS